ncbi:MAG: hypothetical protein CMC68_10050 [Flavobacteriaceae bacterium]|nr:hypothetical protein [Flavobacteriaceae bacterium]|tara:strand:- start:57 stop:815 length:759 start_codon:yes stop_codon:yes gene_type:complete
MTKIRIILIALISLTIISCNTEKHKFPLDKRYWDLNDYDDVVLELNYGYEADEKLPTFDDPETRIIVEKLTDQQNFSVVLDDNELGLKHRNEVAEKFFSEWKNMNNIYNALDRKDQYLYDKEMLAVWHFGLGLQLKYFKLGNDQIKENADDPNSSRVKNNINSNVSTLIKNYLIYLDEINNEKAFTEEGKIKLANGIDKYFPALIELYPNANYSGMQNKAELMLKKAESDKIKSSLKKLIELIGSKSKKETE